MQIFPLPQVNPGAHWVLVEPPVQGVWNPALQVYVGTDTVPVLTHTSPVPHSLCIVHV